MTPPTQRSAEQEHFGAATPGEAQASDPALDPEMLDEPRDEGATPEAVVREFFAKVFEGGDLDAVERFIAPDHLNHDPTAPPVPPGPQGVRQLVKHYREAFPDLRFEIAEAIAQEDRVAHRWTLRGTHQGEIAGIAPTGREVEVSGLEINRIDAGKIAESWALSDAAGLKEQLEATGEG